MGQTVEQSNRVTTIRPYRGWEAIDFSELRAYRDLFYFLVRRDVKVLYAQTILGFAWAVLNPLVQIVIFTVIFGHVADLATDGIPYVLFSTVAIIPWTYMSEAMNAASQSLVNEQGMLGKVYFPRVLYPMVPVFAKLVDFIISLVILIPIMIYYQVAPTWNLLLLPGLVLMMIAIPAALGMWLSALAIRFRDVKFALPFVIRMLIYSAPILYTASAIPDVHRFWYSLNPIVGIIEGFRACLLGGAIPWIYIMPGVATTAVLLVSGAIYFRRMERVFADVI